MPKFGTLFWLAAFGVAVPTLAAEPPSAASAAFALIVGVNTSNDPDLLPLKYADDDAARYFDLFTALGVHSYLLANLDDNTARLHPGAREAAYPPTMRTLRIVADLVALEIDRARANGQSSVVYFVYAGHGTRQNGDGRLTLNGADLPGSVLEREVLGKLGADQTHLIIDACHAELLVAGRGPGGERLPVEGFSAEYRLDRDPSVGMLVATSAGAETHEWERIQAGVFSHEVRSGLYGAADLDRDGRVTYREITAFIERANSAVPNERFRPQVLARPPKGTGVLLEPRAGATAHRVDIDGTAFYGHHYLEDAGGVRLLDFHNAPGLSLQLRRLPDGRDSFLRRVGESLEFRLPGGQPRVSLRDVTATESRTASRGAEHEAFELLFSAPLAAEHAAAVHLVPPPPPAEPEFPWLSVAQWGTTGAAVACLVTGVLHTALAVSVRDSIPASAPQREVAARTREINDYNTRAVVFYGGSAGLGALATWLFLMEE